MQIDTFAKRFLPLLFLLTFQLAAAQKKNKERITAKIYTTSGAVITAIDPDKIDDTGKKGAFYKKYHSVTPIAIRYKDAASRNQKIDADQVQQVVYDDNEESPLQNIAFTMIPDEEFSGQVFHKLAQLVYDGKIRMHAFIVNICTDGLCNYSHTEYFLSRPGDSQSVMATYRKQKTGHDNGATMVSLADAFRHVGGKCENFNQYLKTINGEELDKMMYAKHKEVEKKLSRAAWKREIKTRDVLQEYQRQVIRWQYNILTGIIGEYEKNCP